MRLIGYPLEGQNEQYFREADWYFDWSCRSFSKIHISAAFCLVSFSYKLIDCSSSQLSNEKSFTVFGLIVYPLEGQNEQYLGEANWHFD